MLRRNKAKVLLLFALLYAFAGVSAQTDCSVKNTVFKQGEKASYKIYYHWHFVWLESAQVNFTVSFKNYYGIPSYCLEGNGRTYPKYDWFYKVRDTFLTYLDTSRFFPLRYMRASHEGSTNVGNDNVFDMNKHQVYCLAEDKKGHYKQDSIHIPPCTFDVLSGVYYTRCLNFSNCKYNDTIPLKLYLDGHVYHVHLRYLGKENVSSSFGKFRCVKFTVSLISGTMFKEGQEMTVWATDDANRLPILIEAPIIIGSVRAELESFSNLRNPLDAKVK